jgi:pyrroloquinoline-quinone synthase
VTTARDSIDRALTGRHLLDHPFYRRWEAGALAPGELADYAAQYRHFEAALPGFLASLVNDLPGSDARDAVAANLADEVGDPTHLRLFEVFAESVNAPQRPPSPAMAALLAAYDATRRVSPAAGVAGLLAYEVQGAEIAQSKGDGLRAHYGASPEACVFWDAHATVEVEHAEWALSALDELASDLDEIESAATSVATAWWSFLDERELASTAV